MSLLLAQLLVAASPALTASTDTSWADASVPEALRRAVSEYAEPFTTEDAPVAWQVRWADLNDDAYPDALVYVSGPDWCGSGGCTLLVFEAIIGEDVVALGSYRPAAEISQIHGAVVVGEARSNGWRDLVVEDADGALRALRFDGEAYPLSPADGAPLDALPPGERLVLAETP